MCAISANTNPEVAAIMLHEKLTQRRQEWSIRADHMHMSVKLYSGGMELREREIDGRSVGNWRQKRWVDIIKIHYMKFSNIK